MMSNISSKTPVTPSWLQTLTVMNLDDRRPPILYSWTYKNLGDEVPQPDKTRLVKEDPDDAAKGTSHQRKGGDSGVRPLEDDDAYRGRTLNDASTNGIYILGVGNVGKLFATSLAKVHRRHPGHITLVLRRKEQLEQWGPNPRLEMQRSDGPTDRVDGFDVEWWSEERPTRGPVKEVNLGKPISKLIVSTKAQNALEQVDRVCGYLGDTSTVAFVQNGMNKLWPPHGQTYINKCKEVWQGTPNFISCVTTHGVTSLGPSKSLHASPADVAIGPVLSNGTKEGRVSCQDLIDWLLEAPRLNARTVSRPDLWVLQLEKLVVNSVINPLTAILRCKNGDLFKDPGGPIASVMGRLVQEASSVLVALANEESTRDIYAAEEGEYQGVIEERIRAHKDRFSSFALEKMLNTVGEKVKENRSSMLQDVEAGRSTEIREFNGWLVETAAMLRRRTGEKLLKMDTHKKMIELVEQGVKLKEEELESMFT